MKLKKLTAFIISVTAAISAVSCGSTASGDADTISRAPAAGEAASSSAPDVSAREDDAPSQNSGGDSSEESLTSAELSGEGIRKFGEEYEFEGVAGELDKSFREAALDLSAELLKKAASGDIAEGKNALVSPESVMFALALAGNGAGGDTRAAFEKLLGGDMDNVNKNLCALMTSARKSSDPRFSIADSIWIREGGSIVLRDSYAELCKKRLDAEGFIAPFDDDTLSRLNGWVSEKTSHMINSIKDRFYHNEAAVLVNCIAFEGTWQKEYTDGQIDENGIFTNASGQEEKCVMLSSTEDRYLADDKAVGFMKPYGDGNYLFAAILPNEGISIGDYISSMTGESLSEFLSSADREVNASVKIPEFKFEWGKSIAENIKEMGLEAAFDRNADFSAMAENCGPGGLVIDDIIHKTFIDLNRNGTRAAAVTAITTKGFEENDEPEIKEVTLDRPFIFAIVEARSGLPVFIGTLNSVQG